MKLIICLFTIINLFKKFETRTLNILFLEGKKIDVERLFILTLINNFLKNLNKHYIVF
jgi:hypothetical protein